MGGVASINACRQQLCFIIVNQECGEVVDEGGLSREGLLYMYMHLLRWSLSGRNMERAYTSKCRR